MIMVQLQILNKVLADRDYSIIEKNALDESYFDAYPIEYKFIKDYYDKYRNVPDAASFLDKFPNFDVIEVNESTKYLIDKIREEHLYQESEPILQKYDIYKEFAKAAIELIAELSDKSIEELLENKRVIVGDDSGEIITFTKDELAQLDEYFKHRMSETAYFLGRYCGLRINESYGLKWDHIDFERGTILIDRQMQYQDGIIKLVPVKTKNGVRTIYMCQKLKEHMEQKYKERNEEIKKHVALIEQRQKFIEDLDGTKISSIELVNCLYDGTIQTVNSMKFHSREIKSKLGIIFKYHFLRHTYGTMMAEMNTPEYLLCSQMGHGNLRVTHLYYIAVTERGADILKQNLDQL